MISESPENRNNHSSYPYFDQNIKLTCDMEEPFTRINNTEAADTEVFSTGCSQVNIVWKTTNFPQAVVLHRQTQPCQNNYAHHLVIPPSKEW